MFQNDHIITVLAKERERELVRAAERHLVTSDAQSGPGRSDARPRFWRTRRAHQAGRESLAVSEQQTGAVQPCAPAQRA